MATSSAHYTRAKTIQDFVGRASPQTVADSLRELISRFQDRQVWLGPGHPYRGDVIRLINNTKKGYVPNLAALAQYVACSTLLHAFDGWNYLSRAFDSIAKGDRRTAFHLAYYAELRAAMSLLASQGIGAFASYHVSLTGKNAAVYFAGSTHTVVWDALHEWANTTAPISRFMQQIYVDGLTLQSWLDKAGAGPIIQNQLTKEWLMAWSVDLDLYANDQQVRNEMSYRPDSMRWPDSPEINPTEESLEPLLYSWEALEPSAMGSAAVLDKHLLREALRFAFGRMRGGRATGAAFELYLQNLRPDASAALSSFLLRKSDPPVHAVFDAASDRSKRPGTARPTLARALLLLRIASAAGADLLDQAGISSSDIRFWWSRKIADLGLWEPVDDLSNLTQLWGDVSDAIADVETFRTATPAPSAREACYALGKQVPLCQFQRCGLWLISND
jgi:hypothetical protein